MQSPTLYLCFTAPPDSIQLVIDYWSGSNAHGTWNWQFTLDEISKRYAVAKKDILKLADSAGFAVNLSRRCIDCGSPEDVSSRTALLQTSNTEYICNNCRQHRRQAQQRQKTEEEENWRAAHRSKIAEISQRNQTYDYELIDYMEAAVAFSIMLASDEACEDGTFRGEDVVPLCPGKQLVADLLWRLFSSGVLRVLNSTDAEALELHEDGNWYYYPLRIDWQFATDSAGRSYPAVMRLLGDIIDNKEQDPAYGRSIAELWNLLAYDDAIVFLNEEVNTYNLPNVQVGPKTKESILHALEYFSIPQVRRQIRNVVKNAAALSQRRDLYRRQALNTIPGRLIDYIDRSVSEGWNPWPVLRDWQNEEPVLLTVLFNRILGTGLPGFKSLSNKMLAATYLEGRT